MSENATALVPIVDIGSQEAGRQLYEITSDESVQHILAKRHLVDVIYKYSPDVRTAVDSVQHDIRAHDAGKAAVMAVMNSQGNLSGLASAIPGRAPRQVREIVRRLPPALTSWPLSSVLRKYNPYIVAWTNEALVPRRSPVLLNAAYKELADPKGGVAWEVLAGDDYSELELNTRLFITRRFNPWSVETGFRNSPVHMVLQDVGLSEQGQGWFDNGDSRQKAVPHGTLYALKRPLDVPA